MLSVILYDHLSEVEQLDFVQSTDAIKVITPNPNISDAFRTSFQGVEANKQADIITVPKLMKDILEECDIEITVSRKVELLLELSIVWRIKAPDYSYEAFLKTFNTFTDLRSYTLELALVEQFLDEFDPKEAEMIKLFWLYMEQAELIDEQKANLIVANKLMDEDVELEEKDYVFWGFSHLSGTQIDLLKNLAINHNVYIPFPRSVYNQSKGTDWVRWLDVDESPEISLKEKVPAKVISFDSNRMNSFLSQIEREDQCDILLMQKNPTTRQVSEIPFAGAGFRVAQDIFSPVISLLFQDLSSSFTDEEIAIDDMVLWIQARLKKELLKPLEKKNFRYIKVLGIFLDNVLIYDEKTSQKTTLDSFDLKLLQSLVNMASPRTFTSIIKKGDSDTTILGLEKIDAIRPEAKKIIAVSKSYSAPGLDRTKYSERMAEFLATIAPVRSNELENKLLQFKLENIVADDPQTLFLIEKGILEKSIGWIRLLENFDFEEQSIDLKEKEVTNKDILNQVIKHDTFQSEYWSASRLQTYRDCPRKYYFNYIDKVEAPRNLTYEILAMDLGVLEHDIIDSYLKIRSDYDEDTLSELVRNKLSDFLKKHSNYQLREIDYQNYVHELNLYSGRAIKELVKLKTMDDVELYFEVEDKWKDGNIRGSIDCIVKFSDGFVILDFKRSKNYVTSMPALKEYKKVQLWFYKEHVDHSAFGEFRGMGYLTLGDLKKSQIVLDNVAKDKFKSVDFLKGVTVKPPFDDDIYSDYSQFEKELIESACKETDFLAKPLESKVCNFCDVKNLCPKGVFS